MAVIESEDGSDGLRVGTNKAARMQVFDAAGDSCMDESNNSVRVSLVAGAGSGGTAAADDSAFVEATTQVTPAGMLADESGASDPVDAGSVGVPRMSEARIGYAEIRDAEGNERGVAVTAGNALKVDGSDVTQPVSIAAPVDVSGSTVDATGSVVAATVSDGGGSISVDDNGGSLTVDGAVVVTNAGTFAVQENGAALTALQLIDDVVNTDNAAVGTKGAAIAGTDGTNAQIVKVNSLGNLEVAGQAAHDAAVAGNPLLVGVEARTSDITPVSNNDAVRLQADTLGKLVVLAGALNALRRSGVLTKTVDTAGDVIAAAGAGIKIVVTQIMVTNAHATVGTKVSIRDGTTEKAKGFACANGGGFVLGDNSATLFEGTANTAVTAICATTGADVDITIFGYLATN